MKQKQSNRDNKEKKTDLHRRGLLRKIIQAMVVIFFTALTYPLARFISFERKKKPRPVVVPVAMLTRGFYEGDEFVLFTASKSFGIEKPIALSRTCTHLGCKIKFIFDDNKLECPCHNSVFTPLGEVVTGPAKKPLPTYEVSVQKDAANFITSYTVML